MEGRAKEGEVIAFLGGVLRGGRGLDLDGYGEDGSCELQIRWVGRGRKARGTGVFYFF